MPKARLLQALESMRTISVALRGRLQVAIAMVFDPGEGSATGCLGEIGKCSKNVNLAMSGVSSFVFEEESWLPDLFDNQFNEPSAFNVYLYR